MRVAILGVGGLGRTLASELRADPRVTSLLLTDQFGERARVLTGIPGRVSIEAAQLNVENHVALRKALAGADIVVNTTLPRYNLRIMDAAMEVGANYLDIASVGSPGPGSTPGVFAHEEVETLPRFLGKPIGRVDYKHALHPEVVRALVSLDRLGLLSDFRMIRVGNQMVSFRRALLAAFPEPSALVLPLQGATALTVEVEGVRDGHHLVRRGDVLMSQPDANRRRSTTAVNYLTAVGAAIGVAMIRNQATPGPGVHPPEALDRERVFKEWAARELPMQWSERAVAA